MATCPASGLGLVQHGKPLQANDVLSFPAPKPEVIPQSSCSEPSSALVAAVASRLHSLQPEWPVDAFKITARFDCQDRSWALWLAEPLPQDQDVVEGAWGLAELQNGHWVVGGAAAVGDGIECPARALQLALGLFSDGEGCIFAGAVSDTAPGTSLPTTTTPAYPTATTQPPGRADLALGLQGQIGSWAPGAPEATVAAGVSKVLGKQSPDGAGSGCIGYTNDDWGGLSLEFHNGLYVAYAYDSSSGRGTLVTAKGIGLSSSLAQLRGAYPDLSYDASEVQGFTAGGATYQGTYFMMNGPPAAVVAMKSGAGSANAASWCGNLWWGGSDSGPG